MSLTYTAEFAGGIRAHMVISAGGGMSIEWTPDLPRHFRGDQRQKLLSAYRIWRNDCLADFSKRTGMRIALVEV